MRTRSPATNVVVEKLISSGVIPRSTVPATTAVEPNKKNAAENATAAVRIRVNPTEMTRELRPICFQKEGPRAFSSPAQYTLFIVRNGMKIQKNFPGRNDPLLGCFIRMDMEHQSISGMNANKRPQCSFLSLWAEQRNRGSRPVTPPEFFGRARIRVDMSHGNKNTSR